MKRLFVLILALAFALSLTACGGSKADTAPAEPEQETEETAPEAIDKAPSGVNEDGMGEDPSHGEGIGEVIALSDEEKAYVVSQTTDTWLAMSQQEKDDLVVLIGRWMEDVTGFVVEDYDDMVVMLDRQMEQYAKNGVNENVVRTAGEIYSVAMPLDDPSLPVAGGTPSGIEEDGMGEDPSYGEGIGEVVALTEEEQAYMLAQTTNSWLELSQQEKDDLVVLIGRTLEASDGFIVEDYEDLVAMLDHQMEQYYRNGVDEGVLETACDILGIEAKG